MKIERQASAGSLLQRDAMRRRLSPEEIERQRREYERNMRKILWAMMRKILWAMSPLAIVFFVLWIVAYFWLSQE